MHVAINRLLPEDVLRLIFECFCEAAMDRETVAKNEEGKRPLPAPVALTHVCHYWRAISVNQPSLWSDVDLLELPEKLLHCYAERCKLYPVLLSFTPGFYRPDDHLTRYQRNFVIAHIAQTKSLRLRATDDVLLPWIWSSPAPLLQDLELHALEGINRRANELVLEGPVFTGRTPNLRSISFTNIRMPWRPEYYRNLTRLKITKSSWVVVPQDQDLCYAVLQSPNLEELILDLRLHEARGKGMTIKKPLPGKAVKLKRLHTLELSMPLSYMNRVLTSMVLPRSLDKAIFQATVIEAQAHEVGTFLTDNPNRLEVLNRIHKLSVTYRSIFGNVRISGEGRQPDHRPLFDFTWNHVSNASGPPVVQSFMSTLTRNYSMPSVRHVQFWSTTGDPIEFDSISCLEHMPALMKLTIHAWPASLFAQMLKLCEHGGQPWPHLANIEVTFVKTLPGRKILDKLVALCIRLRAFKSLTIYMCFERVPDADVLNLHEVIRQLHRLGKISCFRISTQVPQLGTRLQEYWPNDVPRRALPARPGPGGEDIAHVLAAVTNRLNYVARS